MLPPKAKPPSAPNDVVRGTLELLIRGGFVPRRPPSKFSLPEVVSPGVPPRNGGPTVAALAATVEWASRVDVPATRIPSLSATGAPSLKTMV